MTSLLISGYFALGNGRRLSSENPTTRKVNHHIFYDTVIQTSGVDIAAEIRTWAPATEALHPEGTVADVLGKLYAPPNGTAWIDVIQLNIFPGDVNDAGYEDKVPERPFPTVFALGHTSGSVETMDDTVSVGYYVQTSEYVRDQSRASRIYCRFDGSKPRWKKTPRPQPGAAVFIVGIAHGIHLSGGNLLLDVDQLQLNVGSASTAASASAAKTETGGTPAKRRRFALKSSNGEASSSSGSTPASATVLPPPESSGENDVSSSTPPAKGKRVQKRKAAVSPDDAE